MTATPIAVMARGSKDSMLTVIRSGSSSFKKETIMTSDR